MASPSDNPVFLRLQPERCPQRDNTTPVPEPGFTVKRTFDLTVASLMLVVALPIIGIAAVLVRLSSPGPAFYSQLRLGLNRRPFAIYKIRTMYHDAEASCGPTWSVPGDSRITPIGQFLRRTHLDELPQLWNVLRGEMSLVGPRPERPEFVPRLEQTFPHYRTRLQVRPGITGLAQVQVPPDCDLKCVRAKLTFDMQYIRHHSVSLDVKILCATALHIIGVPFETIGVVFRFTSGHSEMSQYVQQGSGVSSGNPSLVQFGAENGDGSSFTPTSISINEPA